MLMVSVTARGGKGCFYEQNCLSPQLARTQCFKGVSDRSLIACLCTVTVRLMHKVYLAQHTLLSSEGYFELQHFLHEQEDL